MKYQQSPQQGAVSRWSCYGLYCFFFIKDVSEHFTLLKMFKIENLLSNRCVEKTITFLYSNSDTLVPVKTVQLGEPANITCALPDGVSSKGVHWYKQSVGDTLKLIVSLLKTATPEYGQETFKSRFQAHFDKKFSNLTILKAVQDDEGIYHCGMIEWINLEWTGTYLLVKGKLVNTVLLL